MSDTPATEPDDCDECHGSVRAGYYCAGCGLVNDEDVAE